MNSEEINDGAGIKPLSIEFADDSFDEPDAIEAEFTEIKTPPAAVHVERDTPPVDEFAAFLAGLSDDADVTFVVHRKDDKNLAGQFRIPCTTTQYCEAIYWNKGQLPEEIYNQIARKHGGGKYSFQIRQGQGFGRAWTMTISDPPGMSEKERTLKSEREQSEPERTKESSQPFAPPPTATPPADPLDTIINQAQKMNALRDALFPKSDQPPPAEPTTAHRSVRDELLLTFASQAKDDPTLRTVLINTILGKAKEEEKEENSFSINKLAEYAFENPDKITSFFGGVFSALMPAPRTPATPPMSSNFAAAQSGLQAFKVPRNATPAPVEETQPQAAPAAPIKPKFIPLED